MDTLKAIGLIVVIVVVFSFAAFYQVRLTLACLDGNMGACILARGR